MVDRNETRHFLVDPEEPTPDPVYIGEGDLLKSHPELTLPENLEEYEVWLLPKEEEPSSYWVAPDEAHEQLTVGSLRINEAGQLTDTEGNRVDFVVNLGHFLGGLREKPEA